MTHSCHKINDMSLRRTLSIPYPKRQQMDPVPRKRRRLGTTLSVPRPLKAPGDSTVCIQRTFRDLNLLGAGLSVLDNGGFQGCASISFKLSDVVNSQDITNMFDEYRILRADVTVIPRYQDNVGASDNNIATLGWFFDHNDVSLSGFTQYENPWLERQGYRQTQLDKPVRFSLTPRPLEMVYLSTTNTGYQTAQGMNKWITTANNNVPYYGLFVRVYKPFATVADTQGAVSIYVKLTIECRQTK